MISKRFEAIEGADIERLIPDEVRQGRTIEYKRELPGGSDGDRKEFLADVSSFANTVGGDLLLGIDAKEGIPTRVCGLTAVDLDGEILALDQLILSGLEPRIRHSARVVQTAAGSVLLIRVEASWIGPHRVTLKGHDKFYARNSAGKYPLDVEELRQAFIRSETLIERIRGFREERVLGIERGETPAPTESGAKLIVHFIPHEAFATNKTLDVLRYFDQPNRLQPMGAGGWSHRITLEGVLTYSLSATGSARSYSHLYRTGVIECVDAFVLNREHEGRWTIPSQNLEQRLRDAASTALAALNDLGVVVPVYVFVTLLAARGRWMATNDPFGDSGYAIDRDVLKLPETVVTDLQCQALEVMQPSIDLIWNSCGFRQSPISPRQP